MTIIATPNQNPAGQRERAVPVIGTADLAMALGFKDNFPEVRKSLIELCRRCVIRYGAPAESRIQLEGVVPLPKSEVLWQPSPFIEPHELWEKLSKAIEFPHPRWTLPLGLVNASTWIDQVTILYAIGELKRALLTLQAIQLPGDPSTRDGLLKWLEQKARPKLDRPIGMESNGGDATTAFARMHKQVAQLIQLNNPAYALVLPADQAVITRFCDWFVQRSHNNPGTPSPRSASGVREALVLNDPLQKPDGSLLAPDRLEWRWKGIRKQWEPAFIGSSPRSRTLFDNSIHRQTEEENEEEDRGWSMRMREFMRTLLVERGRYRSNYSSDKGDRVVLARGQMECLRDFLRARQRDADSR